MSGLDFIAPLFVPANRPERFKKAAASGADAIILDLEDAVPPDAKGEARRSLCVDFTDRPVLVRINGIGTDWHIDDVAVISAFPIDGVILPKAEMGELLKNLVAKLRGKLPIIALIETARALRDAFEIAALPGIERLAFGSIDFCAELNCAHTREALLSARSSLVLASRVAGRVPPLDGVTTSVDDADLIRNDAPLRPRPWIWREACYPSSPDRCDLFGLSPGRRGNCVGTESSGFGRRRGCSRGRHGRRAGSDPCSLHFSAGATSASEERRRQRRAPNSDEIGTV